MITASAPEDNPIYVIMIDGEPYTADQGRIRTYKTVANAEREATRLKDMYLRYWHQDRKITIGEFVAAFVKEITP